MISRRRADQASRACASDVRQHRSAECDLVYAHRVKGLQVRFGRPGCALNRPTWSPVKGSSARVSTIRSATVVRQRFFGIPATDTDIVSAQHFWTGGLETAGPSCYDAIAIARTAGFRMLVMSRIRHAAIVP